MTNEQKQQIKSALIRYALTFPSQAQAASHLNGISATTISHVKNNNWQLVSNNLWRSIAMQVGYYAIAWKPADTGAYLLLRILFADAQRYGLTYGIAIAKGLGKTFAADQYRQEYGNVTYINCNSTQNRRTFISALLHSEGLTAKGNVPEMTQQFTDNLLQKDEPLLILDDADSLNNQALNAAIALANSLKGKAGVILMGGASMRTKIMDGVRLNKIGYDEIYKTIGKRFITLQTTCPKDIDLLCNANGIHHPETIAYITSQSNGNLHTATRLIQYTKDTQNINNNQISA